MMVVSMITCTTGSVDKYLEFLSPCLASRLHSCFGGANILFSAHRMWWDFCFGPEYMESFLSTDFFFPGVCLCADISTFGVIFELGIKGGNDMEIVV